MIVGLALVDSINPSAIGVTIYLPLTRPPNLRPVTGYLFGVFTT